MTNRRQFLILPLAALGATLLPRQGFAASAPVFNTDGVAIHGYDPVGYFTEGTAVDGSDAHMLKWMGSMWRFASAENMAKFEGDPRGYAPQYGGYCAFAMAQGSIATTVPKAWTIEGGKLYLNYSKGVRRRWKKDIPGYVAAADMHWPGVLDA
ncbi:MAG: YHS domain-containing (seleno)protein [Paracoccaceae bacterium]